MNNFFKLIFAIALTVTISSCNKDDDTYVEPLRDYSEQYAKDLDSIDEYIDTHYMEVDADYNVTFTEIPENGTQLSIRQQTTYPLDFAMVQNEDHDVNYKVYFIKLREGTKRRPSEVDSVHVAYRGTLITDVQFDYAASPLWFQLQDVVPGWSEIIPKFKTGTYDVAEGPNPVTYDNYGAGIMFLPSGLGYYANSSPSGTIAAYSPLIFSFKLMELRYKDHDRDGILSKDERDPNDPTKKLIDYDSDGDGIANMYDVDDDGDRVLTKNEIKYVYTVGSVEYTRHYPYDGAATDDPITPWDESKGIPNCSNDFTTPTRLRKHLDPSCH
jgi:FKBP-type peptidyl-prolyl cis-trans isomerase FkpA